MFWMRSLHPPVSASTNRDHRKGQVCHDPVSYKLISTFYHFTHDISPALTWELALHCVLSWCLLPDFYGSVYNCVESIVLVTYPFLLNPKPGHTHSWCSLLYSVWFLYFCSSFLIPTRCYHVIIIERLFCTMSSVWIESPQVLVWRCVLLWDLASATNSRSEVALFDRKCLWESKVPWQKLKRGPVDIFSF
jgi:hypothetical protein